MVFTVTATTGALTEMTVKWEVVVGDVGDGRYTAAQSNDFADDAVLTGELTFAAEATGEDLTQTVPVETNNDGDDESNENFTLRLFEPSTNAKVDEDKGSAVGTILDNDGRPSLSVVAKKDDDGNDPEEGTDVEFAVTLTLDTDDEREEAVTVEYEIEAGTANNDDIVDKFPMTETLIFAAGATGDDLTKTVSVETVDDTVNEPNETLTLTLSNPSSNAELDEMMKVATGTIRDNDGPPSLSVKDAEATEGENVAFTVSMSRATTEDVTVDYEAILAGDNTASLDDFTSVSETLTISAGKASGMVYVKTGDDAVDEPDETFTLRLSNVSANAAIEPKMGSALGTILDNDDPVIPPKPPEGTITLTMDPAKVREDESTTNIKVTVKGPKVGADTYVALSLAPESQEELNRRFSIRLPNLVIPKDKDTVEGTIEFTPLRKNAKDDNVPDVDLAITIMANSGVDFGSGMITLIDADKPSTDVDLSFKIKGKDGNPKASVSVSEDEGPIDIEVTATLNGAVQPDALRFALVIDEGHARITADADPDVGPALRDVDYITLSLPSLIIPKRKYEGKTTIRIDPKNQERSDDAVLVGVGASDPQLKGGIKVNPGIIKITDTPLASIKGLTASPNIIRENAGETTVDLKVTLTAALPNDEEVFFTIMDAVDSSDLLDGAEPAERDVDYTAIVGDLTIEEGATEGTATLTLTPVDNDDRESALGLLVRAKVGNTNFEAGIKIVDDETPTTNISLSVKPDVVKAKAGAQDITVTGEINGSTFDNPVEISLVLAANKEHGATAQRDIDYEAALRTLTIPAGEVSGTQEITVEALTGGDKKVVVMALKSPTKNDDDDDVTVGTATITLKDADPTVAPPDPGELRFGADC